MHAPRGGSAIISDSGAFKAIALDFAAASALELPEPSAATAEGADADRRFGAAASRPVADLLSPGCGETASPGVATWRGRKMRNVVPLPNADSR